MFGRFSSSPRKAAQAPFEGNFNFGPEDDAGEATLVQDNESPQTNTDHLLESGAQPKFTDLKLELHSKLVDNMNLSVIDEMAPEEFRKSVGEMVGEMLKEGDTPLNHGESKQLIDDIIDELLGLGALEPQLQDSSITDSLVNSHRQVYVERGGLLELTPVQFKDDRHLLRIIDRIVSSVGRRIDESQPMVDARLKDGSRVNAIIPPLAVDGPLLSIRKFADDPIHMDKLVELGSMPSTVAELLKGIVQCRRNVLISGGTGSGKTTLLNALSAFIDHRERIVTIEDAAELQLQQSHVARLETRPPNIEGKGEVTQRDLLKNALRMRPDRIIVGEVRAGEAFDMLQSMNTGHEGSMTTIHANTGRDALGRLEQMISMSGLELPAKAMREQIASAIHVVVQIQRLSDGRRCVASIMEITGMESEIITMQEIIRFKRISTNEDGKINGCFVASGVRPKFMEEFETRGISIPLDMFKPDQELD